MNLFIPDQYSPAVFKQPSWIACIANYGNAWDVAPSELNSLTTPPVPQELKSTAYLRIFTDEIKDQFYAPGGKSSQAV